MRPHQETPDDMKPSFIVGKFKDHPSKMTDSQIKSGSTVRFMDNMTKPQVKNDLMKRGYPHASVSRSIFGKDWEVIDTYMDGDVVGIPVYQGGLTRYFPKDMFKHVSKAPPESRNPPATDYRQNPMAPDRDGYGNRPRTESLPPMAERSFPAPRGEVLEEKVEVQEQEVEVQNRDALEREWSAAARGAGIGSFKPPASERDWPGSANAGARNEREGGGSTAQNEPDWTASTGAQNAPEWAAGTGARNAPDWTASTGARNEPPLARNPPASEQEWSASARSPERSPEPSMSGGARNPHHRQKRYAIRWMLPEEQNRFIRCVRRMMENGDYSRLASFNGWPGDFKYSRQRTTGFPLWNRLHIRDFEHALQRADRELGGNGRISLPYWDFCLPNGASNRDYVPQIIRDELAFPRSYLRKHRDSRKLTDPAALRLPSDKHLLRDLQDPRSTIASEVAEMLEAPLYQEFATASTSRRLNLEHVCNRMHAALGHLIMDMELSAHHPLFWLVHCNLDRILEGYLISHPDAQLEIEGEDMTPFHPFTNDYGQPSTSRDAVERRTRPEFDRVPKPMSDRAAERIGRCVLMFPNVNVNKLAGRSFQVTVYTVPKHENLNYNFVENPERLSQYFATTAGMPYSPVPDRRERTRPKPKAWFNVYCRIGPALEDLRVTNTDYKLVVIAKDQNGRRYNVEELVASGVMPKPFIGGPVFLNNNMLGMGARDPDVLTMQKYLHKYGYVSKLPNGYFDRPTKDALIEFQGFAGITVDGQCGPITRNKMRAIRFTNSCDGEPGKATFRTGQTITYWVSASPAYLNRDSVLSEIKRCFELWSRATKCKFSEVSNERDATIKVQWKNYSLFCKEPFEFGARGTLLSNIESNTISLDSSEKWLLLDSRNVKNEYKFFPVLLHCIGKVLGMPNSSSDVSVMNPFYANNKCFLMEDDYRMCTRIYVESGSAPGTVYPDAYPRPSQPTQMYDVRESNTPLYSNPALPPSRPAYPPNPAPPAPAAYPLVAPAYPPNPAPAYPPNPAPAYPPNPAPAYPPNPAYPPEYPPQPPRPSYSPPPAQPQAWSAAQTAPAYPPATYQALAPPAAGMAVQRPARALCRSRAGGPAFSASVYSI